MKQISQSKGILILFESIFKLLNKADIELF